MQEMDIEKQLILMSIFLKEKDETIKDIILKISDTGTFELKVGKKLFKELKRDKYILENNELSFIGTEEAKKAKRMFTIS